MVLIDGGPEGLQIFSRRESFKKEENMSENEIINAEWARKNSQTVIGERVKEEIKFCEEAVKKAVADNKKEAYVGKVILDSLTLKELANRGFEVKYCQGDHRDPREHSYYVIKW